MNTILTVLATVAATLAMVKILAVRCDARRYRRGQ